MKRANFRQGGFTLVELVFVIAIIVVLASIFLPLAISKLNKADEAVADASIQEIASALTSFYDDLRHFPTCDASNCSTSFDGNGNDLVFLAFGEGFGDLSGTYPSNATGAGNWDLTTNDETTAAKNNGANHVVTNDPQGNAASNEATDYKTSGSKSWKGPYVARVNTDPWGKTYIAYVGAMESSGATVSGASGTQRGWILSAGPNNSLDTVPSSTTLQSDDRGFIFHTE